MKSLRILTAVFLVTAIANIRGADSTKASAKASPSAKPSPSPSAAPDKFKLPDPVAMVEGKPIKKAELEKEFNAVLSQSKQPVDTLTTAQKLKGYHYLLEKMIIDQLLRTRSADVKISKDELDKGLKDFKQEEQFDGTDADLDTALKKVGQSLDKLKDNIRVELQQQKWIESQIADKIAVTEAEAKAFYDKNPDYFKEPESIRASHILFKVDKDAKPEEVAAKEKEAKAAKARLDKGEDFAKVANELSEDTGIDPKTGQPKPKQTEGGALGDDFIPRGKLVPEFEDAAYKLKKGEVSDPVRTEFGWHIIKLTDKKDATVHSFDEEKADIMAGLKKQKEEPAVNEFIQGIRDKAKVKVFLPPLPKEPAATDMTAPPGSQPAAPGDQPAAPADQPGMPGGDQPQPAPAGSSMDNPPPKAPGGP